MENRNQSPSSSSSSSNAGGGGGGGGGERVGGGGGIRHRKVNNLLNEFTTSHSSPTSPISTTTPPSSRFNFGLNSSDPATSSLSFRKSTYPGRDEFVPDDEQDYEDEIEEIYRRTRQPPVHLPSDSFISRKHLHKTIDSFNNLFRNDNITNINTTERQSTSIQYFTFAFFTVEVYKCFSVGPLMFTPIAKNSGCGWCNVIGLEIIISFMMTISSLFHYTIRRDLFPLLMSVCFLAHTLIHDHPFLEPYSINYTNCVTICVVALLLFVPSTRSGGGGSGQTQNQPPIFQRGDSARLKTPTPIDSPSITPSQSFDNSDVNGNNNSNYGDNTIGVTNILLSPRYAIQRIVVWTRQFVKSKRTRDTMKGVLISLFFVLIGFMIIFGLTTLIVGTSRATADHHKHTLIHYIWITVRDFIFDTPNEIFHINESMVRLFAILYLSVLSLLYHLQVRKPYTIMAVASLVGQIAIALYTFERSLSGDIRKTPEEYYTNPYGGGIFYILNVVSTVAFFCGLSIDVLIASSEKYTRWRAEGEKLHRRLSIELNQQSDFVKRVYQNGTQQMMERLDFTQKFVNNLLISTTQVSNLSMRLSSIDLDKLARHYSNSIQFHSNKTLNLLDDIKLVLAIESGDIMMREDISFNIYFLLEEVFDVISKELKNNEIELVFKVEENVPLNIIGDPSPILQMILQLLNNAIKYTEFGEIGVMVSKQPILLDSPDDDHINLEISVFDTGVGMTDQQLAKCNEFQPFPLNNNLKPNNGVDTNESGTGLGLFICNKIVKIMGGSFEAKHNFGGGMVFSSKLTLQQDRTVVTGDDKINNPFRMTDEQKTIMTGLNILLIDDNTVVKSSTEIILRQFQSDIHCVSSTVEAIRELKLAITLLKPFKVVLVDYHMSGCDGLETIQMLRDNPIFDELKLILLLSPSDLLLQNFKSYKFTCITKPLTPNKLLEGISQAYNIISIQSPMLPSARKPSKYPFIDTSRSAIRILMGESNQEIQNQVQSIIKPFNHIYTIAGEGSNVVSLAQKNYYDVILVNLDLPGLTGFEVAKNIRQQERKERTIGDTNESRISKRRDSLGNMSQYVTSKLVENIPIIGISTKPITNDLLVKSKSAGLTSCVNVESMSDFITNFLLDLEKKDNINQNNNNQNNNVNSNNDVNNNNNQNNQNNNVVNNIIPKLQLSSTPPTNIDSMLIGSGSSDKQDQQQQQEQQDNQTSSSTPQQQSNKKMLVSSTSSTTSSSSSITRKGSLGHEPCEQDLSLLDGLHLSGTTLNSKIIGVKMGGGGTTNLNILKTPKGRSQKRLQDLENVISRFVPIEFQQLIAPLGMENVYLGDCISKTITIFFSDIRDFTSTTEKMLVDDIIDFLNTYLAFAIPAITEKGGFIDKFIGDAIMAIFPHTDVQEQAISAVKAAIGMMKSLDFMSESGFRFNYVETGIGINTGRTIIGIVGTETRMEPTALGDAVNLASRTEPLCKEYGSRILVTQFTVEAIGTSIDEFNIRLVDSVKVKGKSEAVDIYEVIDGEKENIRCLKLSILEPYTTGIEYFKSHRFEEALNYFRYCNDIYPNDKPSLLFIQRCLEALSSDPNDVDFTSNHHNNDDDDQQRSVGGVLVESDVPGMI
ncbi:adenylyl cyclase [Cavenderia fasciculata]|uniref:Adenylyl cyclase n=1 Tax=Cavenderia fasciculata TaxID=261658 RepID=F4QBL1_CACFS|nr:adenylyl cyclase [Cavenderia fasciculata]EGG14599.1 adenylyl cyclase [Cavenderia fasciculata]|eukprot:XP_004351107.1 adenylyl cyclase [Cavenderia fasciculata]